MDMENSPKESGATQSVKTSSLLGKTYKSPSNWIVGAGTIGVIAMLNLGAQLVEHNIRISGEIEANTAAVKEEQMPKYSEARNYFQLLTRADESKFWPYEIKTRSFSNPWRYEDHVTGLNGDVENVATAIEEKTGYPVTTYQDSEKSAFTNMGVTPLNERVDQLVGEMPLKTTPTPSVLGKLNQTIAKATHFSAKATRNFFLLAAIALAPVIGKGTKKLFKGINP